LNDLVHIVCFEAPSPPNYGGAMDVYYKIKCLSEAGKKIILHYFDHKEERNVDGIKNYCYKIFAYKRKTGLAGLSITKPYIVSSRINQALVKRLNKDDHPIIIEGIHGTGIIPFLKNKSRKIIIRIFNNEEVYYKQLIANETNFFKRLYYNAETRLLKKYQLQLRNENLYTFLSQTDKKEFEKLYHLQKTHFIPCLLPWQKISSLTGNGIYCLYHGNLAISENEKAVLWLLTNVFNTNKTHFKIAGKNPSNKLINTAKQYNATLIKNPSDEELEELIKNAHIHVLPSFNKTGVKLKLLHAVLHGRFCITNYAGVEGSGLDKFVATVETAIDYQNKIRELKKLSFTEDDIQFRQQVLEIYNNEKNAEKFIALL
jgi:glycosyltransferase involved in cell wall biosynthesis